MDKIINYFITEKNTAETVAKLLTKTLRKHPDIYSEFLYWIENRSYATKDPIRIEGYTAKEIAELEPRLDVSGVYNFMVTLRENPEKAKSYIENGFPQK